MQNILKIMNKETKIIFSIAFTVIACVLLLMVLSPKGLNEVATTIIDKDILVATTSHMTGSKTAKVTMVEFGDYECPACATINPTVKEIVDTYSKNPNFNFVFRNFPLSQHKNAMIAAEAAEAANAQGKFWEMNELLYKNQNDWAESVTPIDFFVKYATGLGLDIKKFKSDIESKKYEAFIKADKADGEKANVAWTPSFYINGELLQSIGSVSEIKSKIDSLLKE